MPTAMVGLIVGAIGEPIGRVMGLLGVSPNTRRRKDAAGEPLPEIAGHRVMHFLSVLALLRRLVEESGDPVSVKAFDLEGWMAGWILQPQPDLGGKMPAKTLPNPEGLSTVEQLLERMRGGLQV